jgi:hypothetical protein
MLVTAPTLLYMSDLGGLTERVEVVTRAVEITFLRTVEGIGGQAINQAIGQGLTSFNIIGRVVEY